MMSKVKIPYYWVDRWGNGYWSPKPHMKAKGFENISCGKDGPQAWAVARGWMDRWREVKAGKADAVKVWPVGSLGEAYERFKRTGEWVAKKPRTREDWARGWAHIAPVFGDCDPRTVTFEAMSIWYRGDPDDAEIPGLLAMLGVREAHRAMKIWRALWQVAAAMRYCDKDQDPSFGIRRQTPVGRSQRWHDGEAVRLVKRAWREGYRGLACIIAICWDTMFSPVDARTLAARHLAAAGDRLIFNLLQDGREKTESPVVGTLSRRAERLVRTYLLETYGNAELVPSMILFRTRGGVSVARTGEGRGGDRGGGAPWLPRPYTMNKLGKDFRVVRALEFGMAEKRQLLDMRRSGSVEALAGEVDPGALATKMGNTIDEARDLQKTYLPSQVAVVRIADRARLVGRRRLREG